MAPAPPRTATASLDTLPLFAALSSATRQRLAAAGVIHEYASGATLFTAGSVPAGLFIVLSGRVRVVRAHGGRQQVVHGEGPGGTLAEIPFFAGGTLPATALADEPTRCLLLDRDALTRIVASDPDVALLFLRRLSSRVRDLVDRLDRLGGQPVLARLSGFLLERLAQAGDDSFTLGMTQTELAEELGTAREVVVRSLAQLKRQTIITAVGRGRFRVRDTPRLRHLAGTWSSGG